ncbi:MAG: hypothetical protein HWQ41_13725 [Nostoc sp. NOS(2021)]|uniref:hypothetical protein n=1 Tax=Nostoc sp. NOS(2021) TaxID=2815407 RepID=UPI0025D0BF19|nr:hypothetical protein [Nostoc sp. NOS(2021)]MBN3896276.1 hypothetical protein [Nostoc sp. NOS(2021)]
MRTTPNNNSSAVDLLQSFFSCPESVSEKTKCMKTAISFIKAKQDDERRGYLMQEIMRLLEQLGIPSRNQRVLKAMKTRQLDTYKEELDQQLKERDRPFKHLSVA